MGLEAGLLFSVGVVDDSLADPAGQDTMAERSKWVILVEVMLSSVTLSEGISQLVQMVEMHNCSVSPWNLECIRCLSKRVQFPTLLRL